MSLQGKSVTVFYASAQDYSFKRKIMFWLECMKEKNIDCFPLTNSFLNENELQLSESLYKCIQVHLEALTDSFEQYFPTEQEEIFDAFKWVLDVFNVKKKPVTLNSAKYEVIIDLTVDRELKIAFENQSVPEFWLHLKDTFLILSENTKLILLLLAITYLCEAQV